MGAEPLFLENAFSGKSNFPSAQKYSRDQIIQIALRGGYPEVLSNSFKAKRLWHKDYLDAILERDLKDIINIRRKDSLESLVNILCAWSTKQMDVSSIGTGLGIQRPTLEIYINALETLYLIERIKPWVKTDYQRVGKKPKLILNDSGLMASVLNFQLESIRFDSDKVGKLIETHVINELQKHSDATDGDTQLYYYRDREKREIDLLIEHVDGNLLGIEIKSNTEVKAKDFKHLKWFQDNLAPKSSNFIGIVLYTGQHVLSFGKNLWAVPIPVLYGLDH